MQKTLAAILIYPAILFAQSYSNMSPEQARFSLNQKIFAVTSETPKVFKFIHNDPSGILLEKALVPKNR
jgi:hypothetical protein